MIIVTILILNSRVFINRIFLLIHGRLGKFTDNLDLSEAMAGFHTQRTFSLAHIVKVGKNKMNGT